MQFVCSVLFLFVVCLECYRHPAPESFDRFIYEAIVLERSEPLEVAYTTVKHENWRAEDSGVLNSPESLRELQPLYAIRPLYIEAIALLARVMPIPRAIDFISAASYFAIGIVAIVWSGNPILSALLIASAPLLFVGRIGGPDAFAGLLIICGLWMIEREIHPVLAWFSLLLSLAARTDSLILVLVVLLWRLWEKRLSRITAASLAAFSVAAVAFVNHWAGNYGWRVLFRYSLVDSSHSPGHTPAIVTVPEYFAALLHGSLAIASYLSLWLMLGILAWRRRPDPLLPVIGVGVLAHFLLFPSSEVRYFVWAFIVVGILLIRAYSSPPILSTKS